MAKVIAIGQPANDAEREVIFYLKHNLPNAYEIYHNLELQQGRQVFEIDLIIVAPQCVFVVDVKGTHGRIDIYGSKWHPQDRSPYHSPVATLRQHVKCLNTLISETNRARPELRRIHIQATALMTAQDVLIVDHSGKDEPCVTYADKRCLTYFQSCDCIPSYRLNNIRSYTGTIKQAIVGKSAPQKALPLYRDWQVLEKLGGTRQCMEYRACKTLLTNTIAHLKVYQVDPYLTAEERQQNCRLISNAYQVLQSMPRYPHIMGVMDFFEAEDGDCYVLVTEDLSGKSLRQHIQQQTLSLEQKWVVLQEVLSALDHAHQHGVVHRNLTPDTILISDRGQTYLTGFDYARMTNRNSTIAAEIQDDLEDSAAYQAIECYQNPSDATPQSDLFSAGLIFYELLTGQLAFQSIEDLCDRSAIFPFRPTQQNAKLPLDLDHWLQKLCAFHTSERYETANEALSSLTPIVISSPDPDPQPDLDLSNLPQGTQLDDRYEIQGRLGKPGSFGVAYKVLDSWTQDIRVLKLITRDRYSVHDRLFQEYQALQQIPEHPQIVKVIWIDELKNGTPFILFEYVEGQTLEEAIARQGLSFQTALQVMREVAAGLKHIHQQGIFHQDIKPSNLLLTDQGIKIIDFNVALTDEKNRSTNAGTRRYMPPDLIRKTSLTSVDKIDRDLYGLGLIFYECLTGHYPFTTDEPPLHQTAPDPRTFDECKTLNEQWSHFLQKAIAPRQQERFKSVEEILNILSSILASPLPDQSKVIEVPKLDLEEIQEPVSFPVEQEIFEVDGSLSLVKTKALQDIETLENTPNGEQATRPISPVWANSVLDEPRSTPRVEQPIVLDPTKQYPIPEGYIPITTEVEWLQRFHPGDTPYWIAGKRLCDWAEDWLRIWDKTHWIAERKQPPREQLKTWLGQIPIPETLSNDDILVILNNLDSHAGDHPIAYTLADETNGDRQFWTSTPSQEHLASWLTITVPERLQPLEQHWCQSLPQTEVTQFYQPEQKQTILRQWIGLCDPQVPVLGKYPLSIPAVIQDEFDQIWQERLYRTESQVLETLNFSELSGGDRIAKIAYDIFRQQPAWITRDRTAKLSAYLKPSDRVTLETYQAPPRPEPLSIDASPEVALQWATNRYLPFRRWEIVIKQPFVDQRESDQLAESFVDWLLRHYPTMKEAPVSDSFLNYKSGYQAETLANTYPVLWVVVDGLGWLDQQDLIARLTKDQRLSLESAALPLFSILPTKTEYAKWSLYSQTLPNRVDAPTDAGRGFDVQHGHRYTDPKIPQLYKDLRKQKYQLYCWDTTSFDELYHHQTDWHSLYHQERSITLDAIAQRIQGCLENYPEPEKLRVVISSDHGQIMGVTTQLTHPPQELTLQGRMAVGKTNDSRFVVLDSDRFALPQDVSVVKGASSLNAYSYTTNQGIIGSHGGLFPEEVIVGTVILCQSVRRLPVLVTCTGTGKPQKPSVLTVKIQNPNRLALTNLTLYVDQIEQLRSGYQLEFSVRENEYKESAITIQKWPELPLSHPNREVQLTGQLEFTFQNAETTSVQISQESSIVINQIFTSGLNIDDFF